MNFSNGLKEKAKTAKTAEELLEMAKAEGIELSAADAETYFSFLHSSGPLSDEELSQVAGGKGKKKPDPKYRIGQHLWIGYPGTKNYMEVEVLAIEFYYAEYGGWRYLVRTEYGLEQNRYLESEKIVKTYKPQKWED